MFDLTGGRGNPDRARNVLAAISAIAALGFLTLAAVTGGTRVNSLERSHFIPLASELDDIRGCMTRQLDELVPAGSDIWLAPMAERYAQRMTEWAAPRIRVVPTRDKADYVVHVTRYAVPEACDGLIVRTEPA